MSVITLLILKRNYILSVTIVCN